MGQYSRDDLPDIINAIEVVIARAKRLPMTLHPSEDACPYCPCLAQCPAARTASSELVAPEAPKPDLAGLEPDRLAELKGKIEYATSQMDALKKSVNAEIQARHRVGEIVPGWRVAFRRGRRKIPAPTVAYQRAGLDLDLFMDAVEVSATKLEGLYLEVQRKREDAPTVKALKAEFEELMGDAVARAPEYAVIQKE